MSVAELVTKNAAQLGSAAVEHMVLVLAGTCAAAALGVPVGILLTRRPALSKPVLGVANILQTIPSLALFGFLIPVLGAYGIGRLPAIIALFLYALLPIIRNTFAGIQGVDPALREAGRGMGMTDWQLLTLIELPLALGVIAAGVRVATVISVGTATIAAAIGAGGLGMFIFRGLRMNDMGLVLLGSVPAALMALGADVFLGVLERSLGSGPGASRASRRRTLALATAGAVLVVGLVAAAGARQGASAESRVVVASKDFTEQVILGEIVAQALEGEGGLTVERRFELAGDLAHRGLLSGEVDIYVEYTGTALMTMLKLPPSTDPRAVFDTVKREYPSRFGAEWLDPLGFNNTFAILVRGDDARRLGLRTVSDAVKHARGWRAGFGQDFMSRADGYTGFARAYGLSFAEPPLEMDLSLLYRALANRQVDLIAGNSTDGMIDTLGLVQLEDDRAYFPPYQAAPVVRKAALEKHPSIAVALEKLAGKLTETEMRRMNYAVDGEHRDVREVVRAFLASSASR